MKNTSLFKLPFLDNYQVDDVQQIISTKGVFFEIF